MTASSTVDLPLPAPALLALLGPTFAGARFVGAEPIALRSRNRLLRLALVGGPTESLILKITRQETDRFWDHHLRREHWLLQLLQRCWPGGAPRPYAAAFSDGWGLLLTEDLGTDSLAERLAHAPATAPWPEILAQIAELHAALRAYERIFRRICESVELDRLTAGVLHARARVAHRRLHGAAPIQPSEDAGAVQAYTAAVVRPLLRQPRQMIHNSLSPLNVVLDPAPRLVDWETMTYAAPEFDVAELLRFPNAGLDWDTTDQLARAAFGDRLDPTRLRLAALTRALDYAGSNAEQERRSVAASDLAHAATAAERKAWYVAEASAIAASLGLATVIEALLRPPAAPTPRRSRVKGR